MSRDNVVISMDGHTEAFLDLKPWLPSSSACAVRRRDGSGHATRSRAANRYWADLVHAGTEFAWESANELVEHRRRPSITRS